MSEGVEKSIPARGSRRWRRWFCFLAVTLLIGGVIWWSRPQRDARFVGDWQSSTGLVWRFHRDGRLEHFDGASRSADPWGPLVWSCEGDELVVDRPKALEKRIRRWIQNLFSRWTGVQHIGLNGARYRILEIDEQTLRMQSIRRDVETAIGTIETYRRMSVTSQ